MRTRPQGPGLPRSFYRTGALRGIALSATPGRIAGLIGPNGAVSTLQIVIIALLILLVQRAFRLRLMV